MALAHYILFSIVATVFGAMFLMIGGCFLYVCFLTLRGHPGPEESEASSTAGTVSFVRGQTPPPLRHFLVINPQGNPLFGYKLSDIKSTCASFKGSFKSSIRNSFRSSFRRTDIEEGGGEAGNFANPLWDVVSHSSKELRFEEEEDNHPVRPPLADIREWRTM